MFEDGPVNRTKEPFLVEINLVFPAAMAMVHGTALPAGPAVGGDGLVRFGQFVAQGFRQGAGHARRQINLAKDVAIAFVEFDLMKAQSKNLIAIH